MPDSSAEPKLPINSKSRAPAIEGLRRSERRKQTLEAPPDHRAWADYTPTPFQETYAPTPWTQAHKMMGWGAGAFGPCGPGGYMPGPSGMQEADRPGDAQLPEHHRASHPPPGTTPKVWPSTPTPTPGAQPSLPYGFGVLGMPPMPGVQMPRPPNFSMIAEAARDAANLSAMAAAAAGGPETGGSPGDEGSGQVPPFHDDYSGDFDSPPTGAPTVPPGAVPHYVPGPAGNMVPPSRGSNLHGTGRCRPCAWFYKPQGCQTDQSCTYCHLCPEGELKSRKKLKVAAMRMGALTPAKSSNKGRERGVAPRTLKLNPLL